MRQAVIAFMLGCFMLGIFVYLSFHLSPFDKNLLSERIEQGVIRNEDQFEQFITSQATEGLLWGILDKKNLALYLVVLGMMFISFFSSIYVFADKFFFRKFYEEPNSFAAIRRGALIYLVFVAILILRILDALFWENIAIVVLLAVLIEAAVYFAPGRKVEN